MIEANQIDLREGADSSGICISTSQSSQMLQLFEAAVPLIVTKRYYVCNGGQS